MKLLKTALLSTTLMMSTLSASSSMHSQTASAGLETHQYAERALSARDLAEKISNPEEHLTQADIALVRSQPDFLATLETLKTPVAEMIDYLRRSAYHTVTNTERRSAIDRILQSIRPQTAAVHATPASAARPVVTSGAQEQEVTPGEQRLIEHFFNEAQDVSTGSRGRLIASSVSANSDLFSVLNALRSEIIRLDTLLSQAAASTGPAAAAARVAHDSSDDEDEATSAPARPSTGLTTLSELPLPAPLFGTAATFGAAAARATPVPFDLPEYPSTSLRPLTGPTATFGAAPAPARHRR
jgi:hypothetical protein